MLEHTLTATLSISPRYVVFGLLLLWHSKQRIAVCIFYQPALMEKGGVVAYPSRLLHVVRHDNNGALFL